SLTLASCAAPVGNSSASSACGATPPTQLAPVDHWLVPPAPDQIRCAKRMRSSSDSTPSVKRGRRSGKIRARRPSAIHPLKFAIDRHHFDNMVHTFSAKRRKLCHYTVVEDRVR